MFKWVWENLFIKIQFYIDCNDARETIDDELQRSIVDISPQKNSSFVDVNTVEHLNMISANNVEAFVQEQHYINNEFIQQKEIDFHQDIQLNETIVGIDEGAKNTDQEGMWRKNCFLTLWKLFKIVFTFYRGDKDRRKNTS